MPPSPAIGHRGITLHLGLFFDGTGHNLSNNRQGSASGHCSGSYVLGMSNVARLYERYPQHGRAALAPDAGEAALALYVEGVGTREGADDSLLSQATGRYGSGLLARLEALPQRLSALLGDFLECNPQRQLSMIEIDLFGFSRGAAAARHVANQFADVGSELRRALRGYPVRLRFIGLFDTVAAIIAPLKANFSAGNDDYDNLQLGLRPGLAREVMHLVAADEWRANFPLVAGDEDIVLPGSHSDLGGGYRAEETECLLLERPWSSLEPRHLPVEKSQAWRQAHACLEQGRATWEALNLELRLDSHCVDQPFLAKVDTQREKRVQVRLFGERRVRGELAQVYLGIMHQRATAAGVPLCALDEGETRLPEALRGIAAKLRDHALGVQPEHGLSEEEYAVLRRDYIHLSAHWEAGVNAHNPVLDGLHVNRPAPGGQRLVHPNPKRPEPVVR